MHDDISLDVSKWWIATQNIVQIIAFGLSSPQKYCSKSNEKTTLKHTHFWSAEEKRQPGRRRLMNNIKRDHVIIFIASHFMHIDRWGAIFFQLAYGKADKMHFIVPYCLSLSLSKWDLLFIHFHFGVAFYFISLRFFPDFFFLLFFIFHWFVRWI